MASVIRRALGSGPGAGAIALALFFGLDFIGATLDFMGFSADEKATSLILHRYGAQIVRDQLRILATYVVVGAALGGIGAIVGALWDRVGDRRPSARRRAARGVIAALVGHAYLFARSVVHYPQLYSEAFYDRGGARRAAMVWLTQHATAPMLDGTIALVLVVLVGLPLSTYVGRSLVRRWIRVATTARAVRWATAGGLALAVCVVGIAAHRRPSGHAGRQPNVLVLAVDSLRADRVFSTDARRFPALASLAERGVRFREAHVTVPRTFPSFVTLLTGRYPHHHGIRHMFPSAAQRAEIGPSLPSALHDAGYRTAVISDYAGEIFSRTPLGFDHVDVPYFDMKTIVALRGLQVHPNVLPYATSTLGRHLFPAVTAMPELSDPSLLADRAIAELGRAGDRPLFLTVFFSAAHFPYASPDPYYRRYGSPDYAGPYRYQKPPLAPAPATDADRAQIRALYDGAVAATDAAIARIVAHLKHDGLADDTIIVLLADHGENLYDLPERGMGHGDHLRGSAADHVPWVWIDPRDHLPPHDVTGLVRDVDFAPTLAHLVGIAPPPSDGVDLAPLLRSERPTLGLEAYQETELWFVANGPGFSPEERLPYPTITGVTDLAADDDVYLRPEWQDTVIVGKHRAIRTDRWKLLYRPTRAGVLWSLYDLARDPDERTDVIEAHADVAATLRHKLQHWMLGDARMTLRGDFLVPR